MSKSTFHDQPADGRRRLIGIVLSGRADRSTRDHRARADRRRRAGGASRDQAAAPAADAPARTSRASPRKPSRAVTNISSVQVVRRSASPFANDPFFQYFFGDQGEMFGRSRARAEPGLGRRHFSRRLRRHQQPRDRRRRGRSHRDGRRPSRRASAKIIGVDSWTDLALLKIDATGLPVIPWGDSSKLKVAEWVMAVGNPFSLNQTVTLGIVSALGRANVGITQYEDFIQTDAAINPGQLRRRADQRPRRAGRHQHRDLLAERRLPGHRLRRAEQPRAPGDRRPAEVRPGAARIDRLRRSDAAQRAPRRRVARAATDGIVVNQMARDSAAYKSGLEPGDIILSVNGTTIADPSQFVRMIADSSIGSHRARRDSARRTPPDAPHPDRSAAGTPRPPTLSRMQAPAHSQQALPAIHQPRSRLPRSRSRRWSRWRSRCSSGR